MQLPTSSPDSERIVEQLSALAQGSRFAVMRHLNVLEEAGLISREAVGRERWVHLSDFRFEETIDAWARQLRKETR